MTTMGEAAAMIGLVSTGAGLYGLGFRHGGLRARALTSEVARLDLRVRALEEDIGAIKARLRATEEENENLREVAHRTRERNEELLSENERLRRENAEYRRALECHDEDYQRKGNPDNA